MGLILGSIGVLLAIALVTILLPFILFWTTTKVRFENNTKKNHVTFWALLIVIGPVASTLCGVLVGGSLEQPPQANDGRLFLAYALPQLALFVVLLKLIFKENIRRVIGASVIFLVLAGVVSAVVSYLATQVLMKTFS